VTEDHEHDEGDEAAQAPVSTETVLDEEAAEEEAHDAEQGAGEPGEAESEHIEGVHFPGDEQERQATAREQRDQQKAVDKMFDAFQREAKRHTDRIAEIAGDSAPDLLMCPMCLPEEGQPNMPGWLLPVKPSEEKIAAVRLAIGLAPKIDYAEDPYSKVCPTCRGLTVVMPAGATENIQPLTCVTCKAQGWVPVGAERGGAPENGASAEGLTGPTALPVQLEADPPEVAALKARGYTVIEPFKATA
jgi:rubrerythrin